MTNSRTHDELARNQRRSSLQKNDNHEGSRETSLKRMHTQFTQKDARLDNTKCPSQKFVSATERRGLSPLVLLTLRILVCGLGALLGGGGVGSVLALPLHGFRKLSLASAQDYVAKRQLWTRVSQKC